MTLEDFSRVGMTRDDHTGAILKDVSEYCAEDVNFFTPGEIRVECTLKEYRSLVAAAAIRRDRESRARDDRQEIDRLQEENRILQEENKSLADALRALTVSKEAAPDE